MQQPQPYELNVLKKTFLSNSFTNHITIYGGGVRGAGERKGNLVSSKAEKRRASLLHNKNLQSISHRHRISLPSSYL